MSQSDYISLPSLRGTLLSTGPWGGQFARGSWQVFPFHCGAMIAAASSGTTLSLHGLANFTVGDYVMVCERTFYGAGYVYIPVQTKVSRVASVSGSNDEITLDAALDVNEGDWLFNLGVDTSTPSPTVTPAFDGSRITIYTDPVGATATSDYVPTSDKGEYEVWLESGTVLVDVLIADSGGTPRLVLPLVQPGPETVR